MTYEEAEKLFATARCPDKGKPLANNTRLFKRGDDYAVRLHWTDVVTIHPDNTYTLRTGGWETITTKDRINSYAPVCVWSQQGIWYVSLIEGSEQSKQCVLFEEGMRVSCDKLPKSKKANMEALQKKRRLMRKAVSDYIDGFVRHFNGKGFPVDREKGCFRTAGDCLSCQMLPDSKQSAKDLDLNHLLSHIEEGYYVPILFFKVVSWRWLNPGATISITHYELENGRALRRMKTRIHHELEWFFKPLINELTREASQTHPQIFVRQERREKAKRREKRKAKRKAKNELQCLA
jgi:hypothetical protein